MIPRLQTVLGFAMRHPELMMEESMRLRERVSALARNLDSLPEEQLQSPTSTSAERFLRLSFRELEDSVISDDSEADVDLKEEGQVKHDSECSCTNCPWLIETFSECLICRNPLQNRGVHDCRDCGKVWCSDCSVRLFRCAFCRQLIPDPLKPCKTLTTLVNKLMLPCVNHSGGCDELLTAKMRRRHERRCQYGDKK